MRGPIILTWGQDLLWHPSGNSWRTGKSQNMCRSLNIRRVVKVTIVTILHKTLCWNISPLDVVIYWTSIFFILQLVRTYLHLLWLKQRPVTWTSRAKGDNGKCY